MTNKTFIKSLAIRLKISEAEAKELTEQFVGIFVHEVQAGNLVSIQGFGNFEVKEKAERKMYNPTTKSYKIIPKKVSLNFKMSATLKDKINS